MATTVNEVVQIKQLTKYGFQLEDGSYVNWSKNLKDTDKLKVVPGASLEIELYISDKGSKYANSIGAQVGEVKAPPKTEMKEKPGVATYQKVSAALAPRDFDKEARGKTRCALLEALWSNPSTDTSNKEDVFKLVEAGVAFVFGDK